MSYHGYEAGGHVLLSIDPPGRPAELDGLRLRLVLECQDLAGALRGAIDERHQVDLRSQVKLRRGTVLSVDGSLDGRPDDG